MKTLKLVTFFTILMAGMFVLTNFTLSASTAGQEVQTVTVTTTLQSSTGGKPSDLITSFKDGKVAGARIRHRSFALIDRTHVSEVACEAKDAEYGSVSTKNGLWIAVVTCPPGSSEAAIRVPSLIRARASANDATAVMDCWESKELRMGVCYKVTRDPASGPMPQTREHILLARQVGVPSL